MSLHRAIVAATCLAVALTVAAIASGAALSRIGRADATQGCGSSTCPPSSPAAATDTPTPAAATTPLGPPTIAPASIEPASSTPYPSATTTPTTTAATPTLTASAPRPGSLPYIIEGPPPQIIEQIRAGLVPNVTLADLARSQQNVLGAPALAAVAPLAPVGTPIVGTDHGVAILVQYADLAASAGSTQASFQSMLFGTGPDSMRTYYRENSYNQYDIQGDVTNWVTVAHNQNWYADYDGVPNTTALCGYGDDYGCGGDPAHSTQTLIRDAVLAADPYVDFSAYAQGGVVRNLMIIHAGIGAEANSSCHTCPWSVAWAPSGPLVVDGVSIQSAFLAPEYTFTPGDSRIGVYAHEFGHLAFGLPDLYDGDYSSAGVGYWSLMGSGSWLNGGATPSHLDAWSKIHNGWIVPTVVAADGAVNIPAAETSATALKLWTNGAPGSEYFLVENRQQTGFDTYLPGNGLLIWHVDDSAPSNTVDCHPKVLLIPADSGVSMPCAFGHGSTSSPWPGTLFRTNWNGATVPSSRAYSGAQTGVAVMSISASGPIMTANVSVTGASLFNDNVASATDILSTPFTETLNTTSATVELGEPNPCGSIGKTLWYRYTPAVSPPAPVELTVDTVGSDFDTVLAVYVATGASSPPGGLSLVDCNDNTTELGTLSRITFTATPGNVYYIQAGGAAAASGTLVFNADLGPPKGRMSGVVIDGLANPIAGAQVWANSSGCCGSYGSAISAADGSYTITGLMPGNYIVYASATGYATQYYSGTYHYYEATPVTVSPSAETSGVDFVLEPAARISGIVTNELGTPIADASIYAGSVVCCDGGWAMTAPDGTYQLNTLAPGSYRVQASAPGFATEYYDNTYDIASATTIVATSGVETTGINMALQQGGRISGKITDLLGTPIAGAQVYANQSTGYGSGYAVTGADGTYLIDKLPPGNDYKVSAYAPGHLQRFYGGAGDWGTATLVTVSGGIETTGIDIALPPGARISGTVRNWLGTPIAASVFAERADGAGSEYTITAPDGTYLLSSLPTGSYRVQANAEGYPTQYYNGTYDWTAATLVATSSGSETTGIDFALLEGGKISGTVTNALGTPIAGASVYASRDGGGYGSTNAGADGAYVITALRPGNYRVRAGAPGYPSQYYDGTYDSSAATLVAANDGAETPGIDFALPEGGKISGTVTNALGTPIAGAQVYASWDGGGGYGYGTTASDGTYQVTGLMPGDYRVSVWASGYASQYYNGTYDYNAATLVTVTGGGVDTPGIDFALSLTGKISGVVTDMLGTPIAGAYVYANSGTCCSGNATTTASDGTYVIDGLAPINHRLYASAPGYAPQYYDFTYDWSAASLVLVTSGVEASGFNFTLETEAKISGTVTDNLGAPIAGAWVYATRDACCGDGSSPTAADGTYTIVGLPPGSYRVQASSTGYIPQYWDHVADSTAATLLPVSSGTETTAIDFRLMPTDPDNSSTPKDILAFPFTDSRDTTGASVEPGEQQPCGNIGATIWYRLYVPYSPPGSTSVTIDTAGSDFDTAVAVYTPDYSSPSPPGGLASLGCNATGYRSWQTFTADPGTTYYIQVGGQSGATGNLTVHAGVDADADGLRDPVETNTGVYIAPSDTGTDPAIADTDGDACGDGHEVLHLGLSPVNEWDFYSVPAPALFASIDSLHDVKDNRVSAFDAQAIFAYYRAGASTGTTVYDQDLNGNAIPDGIEYDRSYAGPGMTGPPDGVVRAQDAQLAFAQFKKGYKC